MQGVHSTAWCGPQSKSGRTVLREAIQKSIAGGRQAYATEKRRADTMARPVDTTTATPPSHEKVSEGLAKLPMDCEEGRPAEPAPPPFVAGDHVHIRPEFRGTFGIDAPMRARLQLIKYHAVGLDWDAVFSSDHAKGKLTSMFIPNAALMRA